MIPSFEDQSSLVIWISWKCIRLIFTNLIAYPIFCKQDFGKSLKLKEKLLISNKNLPPTGMLEYFTENSSHSVEKMSVFLVVHWHIIFLLAETFCQTLLICLNPAYPSCLILDNISGSLNKSKLTFIQQALHWHIFVMFS